MTGRASRDKGKRGELEAAKILAELLGCDARRGYQRRDGGDEPDVVLLRKGTSKKLPLWVEVKRTERANLRAALEQAIEAMGNRGWHPIVMQRGSRQDWLICLALEDFAEIYRTAQAAGDA